MKRKERSVLELLWLKDSQMAVYHMANADLPCGLSSPISRLAITPDQRFPKTLRSLQDHTYPILKISKFYYWPWLEAYYWRSSRWSRNTSTIIAIKRHSLSITAFLSLSGCNTIPFWEKILRGRNRIYACGPGTNFLVNQLLCLYKLFQSSTSYILPHILLNLICGNFYFARFLRE